MDERELTLAVVGINHPSPDGSNRRFELALCAPGDPVELRLEPTNRHDPRAVAVYSQRKTHLGYLTAERAGWIGGKLRAGEQYIAVFQGVLPTVAYIRARFGGGAPNLPPPAPPREPEPDADFTPDPEPGMWGA